jgi:hypothetical protein
VDRVDGLGGGFRSRRLRVATERAAVFFRAVRRALVVFATGFRVRVRVFFFANRHLHTSGCTVSATSVPETPTSPTYSPAALETS